MKPDFEKFGRAIWQDVVDFGPEFQFLNCADDILHNTEQAGLCWRVEYDPNKHGEDLGTGMMRHVSPGQKIWLWEDME